MVLLPKVSVSQGREVCNDGTVRARVVFCSCGTEQYTYIHAFGITVQKQRICLHLLRL